MEKILIFTNKDSLFNVNRENYTSIAIENLDFLTALKINNEYQFGIATSITDGDIFLINDKITEERDNPSFSAFLNEFDTNKILCLHHRFPSEKVLEKLVHKKESEHIPNSPYDKMLSIISDDQGNKFERLKEEVFGITEKDNYQFLMEVHLYEKSNEIPALLADLSEKEEIKELYGKFKENKNDDNFRLLRDAVLEQ